MIQLIKSRTNLGELVIAYYMSPIAVQVDVYKHVHYSSNITITFHHYRYNSYASMCTVLLIIGLIIATAITTC